MDTQVVPVNDAVPHDIDVERSLLGALLWNGERFHEVTETLEPGAFYVPKHRHLFEAMMTVATRGDAVDAVTIGSHLEQIGRLTIIGGRDYLVELVQRSPSTPHLESYISIIQATYIRRRLQEAGVTISELSKLAEKDPEVLIDESEKILFDLTRHFTQSQYKEMGHLLPELVHEILTVSENPSSQRGIPTGYSSLDNALSGFHPADLIILAARPSVGKTALALDIARRTSMKHGTSVGVFSLEMSTSQLIERMLATESRLDAWRMRTGKLKGKDEFAVLNEAADRLRELPIYINDQSSMSTLQIRSAARQMKRDHNISLLVVDYLQLVAPHDSLRFDSMVHHITEVSRTLKQVARELKIPVVALSQLSRDVEKRAGKPRLSDLRDSGSIEQDADVVMFLHRVTENMYEGDDGGAIPTELLIEKHRNGPTGRVMLQFDRKFASFLEEAVQGYQDIHEPANLISE